MRDTQPPALLILEFCIILYPKMATLIFFFLIYGNQDNGVVQTLEKEKYSSLFELKIVNIIYLSISVRTYLFVCMLLARTYHS